MRKNFTCTLLLCIVLLSTTLCFGQTGNWTATGSMSNAREKHTATLLLNGKVLVTGSFNNSGGVLSSAELYDPSTGIWTETGNMNSGRYFHTATLLQNGKVLVTGGTNFFLNSHLRNYTTL